MNCVIVDDEPLARTGLSNYVNEVKFLNLIDAVLDPLELIEVLEKEKVDLVFLDIQMPKMSGMDFLKTQRVDPLVIITTAFPSYALEGFEYDVVDYLLKPITFDRFFKAVSKARSLYKLKEAPVERIAEKELVDHFFIKSENKYEKIYFQDILFIEAMQNYVMFHTSNMKHMTLLSMKQVEKELEGKGFLRVHKSYIVAKAKISQIESNSIIIGSQSIPISRNYKESVMPEILGDKLWKR